MGLRSPARWWASPTRSTTAARPSSRPSRAGSCSTGSTTAASPRSSSAIGSGLVAGRETGRSFRLGVALDLEHPFHAALDLDGPAFVVPTGAGPPRTGPTGWFFQVDNKSVAITRVEHVENSGDARGWGVAFHLV